MSASMKPTFWCSMTGTVPSLVSLRARARAYSNAARMVPTQAAPISAAVQLNAPVTVRLPCRPGWPIKLAGTRTWSKCTRTRILGGEWEPGATLPRMTDPARGDLPGGAPGGMAAWPWPDQPGGELGVQQLIHPPGGGQRGAGQPVSAGHRGKIGGSDTEPVRLSRDGGVKVRCG